MQNQRKKFLIGRSIPTLCCYPLGHLYPAVIMAKNNIQRNYSNDYSHNSKSTVLNTECTFFLLFKLSDNLIYKISSFEEEKISTQTEFHSVHEKMK